jgi:hypothetical protein
VFPADAITLVLTLVASDGTDHPGIHTAGRRRKINAAGLHRLHTHAGSFHEVDEGLELDG